MAELGLLGIVVPEEYGGAGLDFVARRSPARRSSAARRRFAAHLRPRRPHSLSLLRYATEERSSAGSPAGEGEKLACFGLTEPGAGSDVAAMRRPHAPRATAMC